MRVFELREERAMFDEGGEAIQIAEDWLEETVKSLERFFR